ncbi:MAG TPA: hypothetical protein VKF62_09870 [Planctomycetota bacterium]|nr:hypothetical protein [Planctomycetota bacterium]
MKRLILCGAVAVVLLAGGVFALRASSERADCPGKIVCPITGEVVCADHCPLAATGTAETPSCCKQTKP